MAPLEFDSNLSWSHTISGLLDKRPALEFLVGLDRDTGTYIPELAEKWEMAPDGQTWTVTLRKGVKFHENWGSSRLEMWGIHLARDTMRPQLLAARS